MSKRRQYVDRRPAAPAGASTRMGGVAIVTVAVLGLMIGAFWSMTSGTGFFQRDSGELTSTATDGAQVETAPQPTPAGDPPADSGSQPEQEAEPEEEIVATPPPPGSNELVSGTWLLSPYAILKDNEKLVISGTLQNRGAEKASGEVRVFVYVNDEPVASGIQEVTDVAPNGAVDLLMPTGKDWVPGNKVLFVDVVPLDQ